MFNREKQEMKRVPMMPVRDMVIFPQQMTPFIVGREASVRALEEALILLKERVLGFGEDADEGAFVEIVHDPGDRQAADKFGNQTVADQIARLHLFEQFGVALLRCRGRSVGVEAE